MDDCIFCHIVAGEAPASFVHRDDLARTLRSTDDVRADGVDLFAADGEAAGQEVFHAHLHVIPRFHGDGFEIDAAAWRDPSPTREQLDASASAIGASSRRDVHAC